MKKRIIAVVFSLMLCLLSLMPAFAIVERPLHIFDENGIFTAEEFNELEDMATDIESEYGYCVMYCVTDQVQEGQTYEYCEAQYTKKAQEKSGIMLTHDSENKKYALYVSEDAETVFTDGIQDTLGEAYNNAETYYDGVVAYLEAAEFVLKTSAVSASVTEKPSKNASGDVTVDPNLPTERLLPLVVDQANLLSDEEEKQLIARLEEISDRFDLDLAVVTVTDFGGKTPEAFADDFYDYNGYGRGENADGALLVYKPGEQGDRRLQISTCGKAIEAFSDADISNTLDSLKSYIIDGDYIGAFQAFADRSEYEFEKKFEPSVSVFWIPVCLIIGFIAAFVIMKIATSSLKSVRHKVDAGDYASNVTVTNRSDTFLYRNVSKTPIPKESSSSGSSTHTSSSGSTHGGGGSSF
ncbi:MAG: TPM domain-containing protein [Acutalibacteraceae bacterium]